MKAKLINIMPNETAAKRFMRLSGEIGELKVGDRVEFYIGFDGFITSKVQEVIVKTRNSEYVFKITEE